MLPLSCVAKRKKEIVSKQKLLKSCQQGQNFTVLAVLERLELKIFLSVNHGGDNTSESSMGRAL